MISSLVFCGLIQRLFADAHCEMLSISLATVWRFSEATSKYESSAYLSRILTAFREWRSKPTTTYDGGLYHGALYDRSIYCRECRHQSICTLNFVPLC